jgi:hypothetical protein
MWGKCRELFSKLCWITPPTGGVGEMCGRLWVGESGCGCLCVYATLIQPTRTRSIPEALSLPPSLSLSPISRSLSYISLSRSVSFVCVCVRVCVCARPSATSGYGNAPGF